MEFLQNKKIKVICICIRVLQKTRTNGIVEWLDGWINISRKSFILRNRLTQLWRLRSPVTGHFQAGNPGEPVEQSKAESGDPMVLTPVQV